MKLLSNKEYKKLVEDSERLERFRETAKYEEERRREAEKYARNLEGDYERKYEVQDERHQKEIDSLNADHENELAVIELRKDKEYNARVREAEAKALGLAAEIKGKEEVIKTQQDTMKRLSEQMEFLCGLIPTVDLSKLNFSVTNNQQVQPASK